MMSIWGKGVLYTKNTWKTLKYHLVTAEPPFTVKTIEWIHQTGPRILLSVTHVLYVSQVCRGVGCCVKDGSCSLSSLSESQWTVLMVYLTISTNVDTIKHITDDNFSFRKTAHWCSTVQLLQHSRLMQHFSEKCDFSSFLVLPGSAEAQVIWGGILKHLLIAYFTGNIPAKNIKICSCVSKLQVIGGTFFWDTVYIQTYLAPWSWEIAGKWIKVNRTFV